MSVMVRYNTGATLTYHLVSFRNLGASDSH